MNNNLAKLGNLLTGIKYPSLTEKSITLYQNRQYSFLVARSLTKSQVKLVLQQIFNVTIIKINSTILPSKTRKVGRSMGQRTQFKKVFITLKPGQSLTEVFN